MLPFLLYIAKEKFYVGIWLSAAILLFFYFFANFSISSFKSLSL